MAARIIVVDSGGTSRQVRRFFVIDAGGTPRLVSRAFVIDAGGTARLIYSGEMITLGNTTVIANTFAPQNPSVSYSLNSNGTITGFATDLGTYSIGNWVAPSPPVASYEVFATLNSGTASGTFGSWLPLSSNRTWSKSSSSLGLVSASIGLQIRDASGTVVDTATITLSCNKDS